MSRYKILIEYNGYHFKGWQRQKNGLSIQGSIESAIKKFSNEDVLVYGAGRTDAGVHANGQVAHFELHKEFETNVIKNAINHFVKPYISVLHIEKVTQAFHARFSAVKKRYIYKIINRDSQLALMHNYAWLVKDKINVYHMKEAAQVLLGKHDFTSFRSASCQSVNPVRTIDNINIEIYDELVELQFEGKSFLHNQVRIMTGALKEIGIGKWDSAKLKSVLLAKDRKLGPVTAPPHGLYLNKIWYND